MGPYPPVLHSRSPSPSPFTPATQASMFKTFFAFCSRENWGESKTWKEREGEKKTLTRKPHDSEFFSELIGNLK